jgi:hypothetical protein
MLRNVHLWLPGYLAARKRGQSATPTHVLFCFVDHYEPYWGKPSVDVARRRVRHWTDNYPALARFRDADGRPPQHTFFYPAEEYVPEHLDALAHLCRQGYGEVEIHLHHRNDTAENLRSTLEDFKLQLAGHGFLSRPHSPSSLIPHPSSLRYAFIHGNWSLDNSRRDGDWCGVNNELQVLRDTGCYADFTLPSAPSECQTRKVNSIYYATDDPQRPKSHDTGEDVCVCSRPALSGRSSDTATERRGHSPLPDQGDLLLIQGPLALNWRSRKWGLLPRIEAGNIAGHCRPTADRVRLWLDQRIGVAGRPDWVFIKVHTHGCQEENFAPALDGRLHELLAQLPATLHYVTAREMYNLVKAAEAGQTGNPSDYRNFLLPPPLIRL